MNGRRATRRLRRRGGPGRTIRVAVDGVTVAPTTNSSRATEDDAYAGWRMDDGWSYNNG